MGFYEELDRYVGSKTHCDNCNRAFEPGEVITVDEGQNLVFCYSDDEGGCMMAWVFSNVKAAIGNPMRFGDGVIYDINKQAPNYPKTPIIKDPNKPKTPKEWIRDLLKRL